MKEGGYILYIPSFRAIVKPFFCSLMLMLMGEGHCTRQRLVYPVLLIITTAWRI